MTFYHQRKINICVDDAGDEDDIRIPLAGVDAVYQRRDELYADNDNEDEGDGDENGRISTYRYLLM